MPGLGLVTRAIELPELGAAGREDAHDLPPVGLAAERQSATHRRIPADHSGATGDTCADALNPYRSGIVMTFHESSPGAERVLARSEPAWWALVAVNLFAVVATLLVPWADAGSRISAPAVAGALFAAAVSGATARWASCGRTLTGHTDFRVITLDASHVQHVEEERGLTVVTSDDRMLTLTGQYKRMGARFARHRTAREAARIRAWLVDEAGTPAPAAAGPQARARWGTLAGMLLAALLAPAIAVLVETLR